MPTFCSNDICQLQVHIEPHPLFLVCICMQQLPFTACIVPHPLICCRSSTPAICQGILSCNHVQWSYNLHEATSIFTSHILVSTSLNVAIPTNPMGYQFLSWVYIARFLQCVISTISECVPQFITSGSDPDHYPDQWVIQVSSRDQVLMLVSCQYFWNKLYIFSRL